MEHQDCLGRVSDIPGQNGGKDGLEISRDFIQSLLHRFYPAFVIGLIQQGHDNNDPKEETVGPFRDLGLYLGIAYP